MSEGSGSKIRAAEVLRSCFTNRAVVLIEDILYLVVAIDLRILAYPIAYSLSAAYRLSIRYSLETHFGGSPMAIDSMSSQPGRAIFCGLCPGLDLEMFSKSIKVDQASERAFL